MAIDFASKYKDTKIYEKRYNYLLEITLKILKLKCEPLISVTIGDNATIKKINKDYRHIDKETDVISFAFLDNVLDKDKLLKSKAPLVLGDIYISKERAETQAKEIGNSIEREMNFLFIHGLLHLLGYDHMEEKQAQTMFDLQDKILSEAKDGLSKII